MLVFSVSDTARAQADACEPVLVQAGNTFKLAPFDVTGSVTKASSGWQSGSSQWFTRHGGNFIWTATFDQPIPAEWLQVVVQDLNPPNASITTYNALVNIIVNGENSSADFIKQIGDLEYSPSTGTISYQAGGPFRQLIYLNGNTQNYVNSIEISTSGVSSTDAIALFLYVRAPCLTLSKLSKEGIGSFQINMSNVALENSDLIPNSTLATITPSTEVISPKYFVADPQMDVMLTEELLPGWSATDAVCTDRNALNTGNPGTIGNFTTPSIKIPAANLRPQADLHCTFTNVVAKPGLTLKKTAKVNDLNGNALLNTGETITYSFLVTNTGTVPLANVTINDPKLADAGISFDPPPQGLAPGASVTFTALYKPTQIEIDSGIIKNTATGIGKSTNPLDPPVESPPSTVTLIPEIRPELSIKKIAKLNDLDGNDQLDIGETITYSFLVTNTGTSTLTDVTVNDPLLRAVNLPLSPDPQTLAPGEKAVFTATYAPTPSEIDSGGVKNTATAIGKTPNPNNPPVISPPATVFTKAAIPKLVLLKKVEFSDVDGNGYVSVGDVLVYTLTVTNSGGMTISDISPSDGGPTFNGLPAENSLSRFEPEQISLKAGQSHDFTASYILTQRDIRNASADMDVVSNIAVVSGRTNLGEVFSNQATSDFSLPTPKIVVSKIAHFPIIRRGEQAPFTINVTNNGSLPIKGLTIIDMMPVHFFYVDGTASIDGLAVTPEISGRQLRFTELDIDTGATVKIKLTLHAMSTAKPGEHVNMANAEAGMGNAVGNKANASFKVELEPVFDCGEIVGKVFNDRNSNGYQDEGEEGIAGAKVTTVSGMSITTDKQGRFSIACADLPDARIGSNFIVKLDPRSLPTGYRLISENPRSIRLTAGKASQANFAVSLSRIVRLDVNNSAFLEGATDLLPQWQKSVHSLLTTLEAEPSILRIFYQDITSDKNLSNQRLKKLHALIAKQWRERTTNYRLEIEAILLSNNSIVMENHE